MTSSGALRSEPTPAMAQRFRLLVLSAVVATSLVVATVVIPEVLKEKARDWEAYAAAGQRLSRGLPIYVWEGVAQGASAYLYPPLMAWLWSMGMSPGLWLLLKAWALGLLVVLGPLAGGRAWPIGVVTAALVAVHPAVVHDFVLGNVMGFYAGAIALSLARAGWLGALPLGAVIAFAAKPFVAPYLLWLAMERKSDAVRVLSVVLALTSAGVVLTGPSRYVQYAANLPMMSVMNRPFSGNVGLSSLSGEAGFVGVLVAWTVTLVTCLRIGGARAAVVAIAMTLLAQPAIGVAYAAVLAPALAVLWHQLPRRAAPLVVVAPLIALIPIIAAIGVAVAAGVPTRAGSSPRRDPGVTSIVTRGSVSQ
jgi:hypothetical protein